MGLHKTEPTEPEYGVRTCGKTLDPPFDGLGPCLLKPEHDDVCMVQAPGMAQGVLMNVKEVDGPPRPQLQDHPWYSDDEVQRYRRISKRMMRMSFAVLAFNALVAVWNLLVVFDVI